MELFFKNKKSKHIPDKTDLIDFNKELFKEKEIKGFKIKAHKKDIDIDLDGKKIKVDNKDVNIDLKEDIFNIRPINFKRHTVSIRLSGGKRETTLIGSGFQGNDTKGNNIQRFILIDEEGNYQLHKRK